MTELGEEQNSVSCENDVFSGGTTDGGGGSEFINPCAELFENLFIK